MSTNIHTASQQWSSRPADERFTSLADLHANALQDRQTCRRGIAQAKDMKAIADGARLLLNGTQTAANLTNHAYSQLCTVAGAPAGYLRTLPAPLAADCINHGIERLTLETGREQHALLLRNGGPADAPYTVRAITSTKYSRVWDVDVISPLQRLQDQHPQWQLPMTWNNIREGAYRGDRDMFVFMTNGGSILEDPTLMRAWSTGSTSGNGQMYRGIIVRNSEVGASSLIVEDFLFRMVCGNHIVWHASEHVRKSRRHVGLTSYTAADMIAAATRTAQNSARQDEQTIAKLGETAYAKTKDDTIAQLRKDGLTQTEAAGSYDKAETYEHNPRSFWGIVNGITRYSQTYNNQDDRYALDQLAGRILSKGRIAVAA